MDDWSLPGYEVQELLGFGAAGEVWSARSRTTGELVALKRLRAGADPAAVETLRHEAAVLRTLDTPYVVRLREVVDGVLVLDHAAGGSLAALLSRRGCLDPGEVVTVGVPIATALSAVHAAGLVHGDVSPANVLFTAEGMPLLTDLGVARPDGERSAEVQGTAEYVDPAVARGAAPGPASDVWALAAVCHHLLAGAPPHEGGSAGQVLTAAAAGSRAPLGLLAPLAPRALVAVVEAALADDATGRPTAAAFAVALQRAHTPAAVRLSGPPPAVAPPDVRETHTVPRPPRPPEPPRARRRWPLAALGAGAVALALLLGGLTWALHGGPGAQALPVPAASPTRSAVLTEGPPLPGVSPPGVAVTLAPAPSVSPSAPAGPGGPVPDWGAVLAGLDAVRARAFAVGDAGLLTEVYVEGSPAAVADATAVAALVAAGRTADGVRHEVRRVEQQSFTGDRARLRVVDVLGSQSVRDRAGAVVQTRPGRGEAAYEVVLVRQQGEWRIAALQSA